MTIELLMCIGFMLIAIPVSDKVAIHYAALAGMNFWYSGFTSADASILAMSFGAMAVLDAVLILTGGTLWLLPAFIASAALAIESASNGDWLLSHSTTISAAVNAVIIAYLFRGYLAWMRGRHGR